MTVPVHGLVADLVPIVCGADAAQVRDRRDLARWGVETADEFTALLYRYGAVLLRGFPIYDAEDFAVAARAFAGDPRSYTDGNSPRTALGSGVYTSTEYPAAYRISLHNELSYANAWPSRLAFYCETPASTGGETLLARGTVPLDALSPATLDRFREAGVSYTRNLHGGQGPGRSWQDTFETHDRVVVADYLTRDGAEFAWRPNGGLRIQQTRSALRRHPMTGTEVWFNQADQWHPSNLNTATRKALTQLLPDDEMPLNASFGDGQPLEESELDTVRKAFAAAAVAVPWRRGDLLVVDNLLLTHGRASFTGERRILVSMA